MVAKPLTTERHLSPLRGWRLPTFSFFESIRVPGASTLKKFLMRMGMSWVMAGKVDLGCKTFAPK